MPALGPWLCQIWEAELPGEGLGVAGWGKLFPQQILERQGGSQTMEGLGWVLLPTKLGQVLLHSVLLSQTEFR